MDLARHSRNQCVDKGLQPLACFSCWKNKVLTVSSTEREEADPSTNAHEPTVNGVSSKLGPVLQVQSIHDVCTVGRHGSRRYVQRFGKSCVGISIGCIDRATIANARTAMCRTECYLEVRRGGRCSCESLLHRCYGEKLI